jgi:ribosomal-protein-alanine N-acetyltransferase
MKLHMHWWTRRDMPDVLDLEESTSNVKDLSPKALQKWRDEREAEMLEFLRHRSSIGMVVEDADAGGILGYIMYELHKKKLHVVKMAAVNDKVSEHMLKKMKSKLSSHRRTHITLDVRETDMERILFYQKMGFLASEVIRNHYDDTGEDAYVMYFEQKTPILDEVV